MLITVVLLFISFVDYKQHKIHNSSICVLISVSLLDPRHGFNLELAIATFIIGFLGYRFLQVGAGDVKLIAAMMLVLIPSSTVTSFWICFAMISTLLIILRGRSQLLNEANLPLAPALCGAVLCVIGLR